MDEALLLEQLVVQVQYLIGLLAFLSGVVLAFVFVFGMRH